MQQKQTDPLLDYYDEIVEIVDVGIKETIDIGVTGDNLFYCNDILTKNSIGLPSTVDVLLGIIFTEEMDARGEIMFKQLKNRFNDINKQRRFIMGVEKAKMRLFNIKNTVTVIPDLPEDDSRNMKSFDEWKFD